MPVVAAIAVVAAALAGVGAGVGAFEREPAEPAAERPFGELPVRFEATHGQSDPAVRYLARAGNYTAFLTDSEAVVVPATDGAGVVRMGFVGGNPRSEIQGLDQYEGVANYVNGADRQASISGVPTYAAVAYRDVYPGIDALFRDDGDGLMAYDFIVAPGADPASIALAFDGNDDLAIDPTGDLVLTSGNGELRQSRPVVYQEADGIRHHVDGSFALSPEGRVSFELGDYDPSQELVIDPVLSYSTYFGSNNPANSIAVDDAGSAYVIGQTFADDLPTVNPLQPSRAGSLDVSAVPDRVRHPRPRLQRR